MRLESIGNFFSFNGPCDIICKKEYSWTTFHKVAQGVIPIKKFKIQKVIAIFVVFAVSICLLKNLYINDVSTSTFSPLKFDHVVIIDAGHGGEDGGAVSVSGAIESQINLEIALRLDSLMGLFGVPTVLLRDSDISLHDSSAQTLRQKKNSDLKNRVKIIESFDEPTVISIHQNTYTNSKYCGAQVFYANGDLSSSFAQITQDVLRQTLNPDNDRKIKPTPDNVYLMNHISCQALLVECGFLSNPKEDQLLQSETYQTRIAASLTGAYLQFQCTNEKGEGFDAA